MLDALKSHWFLVGLAVLIPLGLAGGVWLPDALANGGPSWFSTALRYYPRGTTALILFLMAFSLDSRQMGRAIRAPAPVLLACLINMAALPALAWVASGWQLRPDFQFGLLIAACVPCTMAAASVWTRKAGGNDAVALMVTLVTNGLCFAITPALLSLTTGRNISLSGPDMLWRLVVAVLLPCLLGQLFRLNSHARNWATENKRRLSTVAQMLILTLVFSAAWKAGSTLGVGNLSPGIGGVALVWGSCIVLHLLAMGCGWGGAKLLRTSREDGIALLFASSQKTLPVGVLIATDPAMFGNPNLLGDGMGIPFAVFPMLMFHASQLFIDTAVAQKLARADVNANPTVGEPTASAT